jgi:hypothetical protein
MQGKLPFVKHFDIIYVSLQGQVVYLMCPWQQADTPFSERLHPVAVKLCHISTRRGLSKIYI